MACAEKLQLIFNNAVLIFLLLVSAAIWLAIITRPDSNLHYYFCDVGQGDAILVKSASNQYILIDGGPDRKVLDCLSKVMPFYEHKLDLVILTHNHADHFNGLIEVLKNYSVQKVAFYQTSTKDDNYREFIDVVKKNEVESLSLSVGDQIKLSSQASALVLHTVQKPSQISSDTNSDSTVLSISCGSISALFLADLPADEQSNLPSLPEKVDILKVSHHGSRDGLNQNLLDRIKPSLAVISVGEKNSFGHPNTEVVKKLEDLGTTIKRTDKAGTIDVVTDCQTFWIH